MIFDKLAIFLATGFGSGYSPKAPGTAGSFAFVLLSLPFVYGVLRFPLLKLFVFGVYAVLLVVLFVLGLWSSSRMMRIHGIHDDKRIVIDEWVGQGIVLLPILYFASSWSFVMVQTLVAFLLFRFFDVLKPLFIKRVEKFPGAWGVMLDDVLAGIYAALSMWMLSVLAIFGAVLFVIFVLGAPV